MADVVQPGVCSWSLQPSTPADLVSGLSACGVTGVQLALDPIRAGLWDLDETRDRLGQAGMHILSGMMGMEGEDYSTLDSIRETGGVRLDAHWVTNLEAAEKNGLVAAALGIELVTFHAGFLPHDAADPLRRTMIERLRSVIDAFGAFGIRVGFETGQESAPTLLGVLEALDRPGVGVNFDPANMILYDMGDPVEAARHLAPHIVQVHIKDATRTETPGTWGEEVRFGTGDVPWGAFFRALREGDVCCDLVVEREAGETRIEDIRAAVEIMRRHGEDA